MLAGMAHAWDGCVEHRARILAAVAVLAIAAGGALHLAGSGATGDQIWRAAVALLAAELAFEVGRTVVVDRHMGVDTIALVAMVGSLALGQELAGVVVGLMFSGGAALEDVASTRARRELTALVQRAPKVAQLRVGDRLEQVPVEQVRPVTSSSCAPGRWCRSTGPLHAARPWWTRARSAASRCR